MYFINVFIYLYRKKIKSKSIFLNSFSYFCMRDFWPIVWYFHHFWLSIKLILNPHPAIRTVRNLKWCKTTIILCSIDVSQVTRAYLRYSLHPSHWFWFELHATGTVLELVDLRIKLDLMSAYRREVVEYYKFRKYFIIFNRTNNNVVCYAYLWFLPFAVSGRRRLIWITCWPFSSILTATRFNVLWPQFGQNSLVMMLVVLKHA